MSNDFLKGIKISLGIIFGLSVFFGIVYAVGFHSAEEILGGKFQGDYIFNGSLNLSNTQINGLETNLKSFVCTYSQSSLSVAWHFKTWTTGDCGGYLPNNYANCVTSLREANGAGASAWQCNKANGGAYTNGGQIVMMCSYLCWN